MDPVTKGLSSLRVSSPKYEDITDFLDVVADAMDVGELVHNEEFSLHQAMSAMELMNPKMDPAMLAKDVFVFSLEAAVHSGRCPTILDAYQIIAIMDELTCKEASFLKGHSLAQSVFTCMYAHGPDVIAHYPPLRLFVLWILKSCSLYKGIITTADVFTEEYFVPSTFEFNLFDEYDERELSRETTQLEAEISQQIKAAASGSDGLSADSLPIPVKGLSNDHKVMVCSAILQRLQLRRALYSLHSNFHRPQTKGLKIASKMINRSLQLLNLIKDSVSLGTTQAPAFDDAITQYICVKICTYSVTPIARIDALFYQQIILDQLSMILPLVERQNYEDILLFVHSLADLHPTTLVRSHLILLMHSDSSFLALGPLQPVLQKSIEGFSQSALVLSSFSEFHELVSHMVKPVCQIFRLLCKEPETQLALIERCLVDWSMCQQEANTLDNLLVQQLSALGLDINSPHATCLHPFFSWTLDQTVQLLIRYILLMFELHLVSGRECCITFWHLAYMLEFRLQSRKLASKRGELPFEYMAGSQKLISKTGPKNKRKKQTAKQLERERIDIIKKSLAQTPDTLDIALTDALRSMAAGTYITLLWLQLEGVYCTPKMPFGSDSVTFEHRFACFGVVPQPSRVSLNEFAQVIAAIGSTEAAYAKASAMWTAAKNKTSQLLREPFPSHKLLYIQSLMRVSISNGIFMSSARKLLQQYREEHPNSQCEHKTNTTNDKHKHNEDCCKHTKEESVENIVEILPHSDIAHNFIVTSNFNIATHFPVLGIRLRE